MARLAARAGRPVHGHRPDGGRSQPDLRNVDHVEEAMLTIAPHAVDENWMSDWLCPRVIIAAAY
jgi:hypothetical protein